jgi:hypothetical protein
LLPKIAWEWRLFIFWPARQNSVLSFIKSSLITEDKWGCLPILYAIWCDAPQEVTQFLVDGQKSAFPNHILSWDKMIETLCRAGASLDVVKRLFDTQREFFPDQSINWKNAARELTIRFLVERTFCFNDGWRETLVEDWGAMVETLSESQVYHQELAQSLVEIEQRFFANQNHTNLQLVCEEFVQPLKGWWRPDPEETLNSMWTFWVLVKCNIPTRLNAIGVRKWRMHIKHLVEALSSTARPKMSTIHSKLITYEHAYPQFERILIFAGACPMEIED